MKRYRIVKKGLIGLLILCGVTNWTISSATPANGHVMASRTVPEASATAFESIASANGSASNTVESATANRAAEAYGQLPLRFEANAGQTDPRVKFVSRGRNHSLFLSSTESVLVLNAPINRGPALPGQFVAQPRASLVTKLIGANPRAKVETLDELPGKTNYFKGKDPNAWRTGVPSYSGIKYRNIYSGVDLIYYGNKRQIEYDFVINPGADVGRIKLSFKEAKRVRVDAAGDLVLTTSVGEVRQKKPFAYQEVNGTRRPIAARYVFKGKRRIAFRVGAYDLTRPLVIDPVLSFSSFLGGSNWDEARAIAVDGSGNTYIAGRTASANFPVVPGSFDTTYNDNNETDVFITKLNPAGTSLVYSTFVGGGSDDTALAIAIDSSGKAFVTGSTRSSQFPTTPGAFQTFLHGGTYDGFVTVLNSAGSALVYSTFLGGGSDEQGNGIACDSSGNAYVTGGTSSSNFPTTPGAFRTTYSGGSCCTLGDAFVTKLNPTGTAPVYSTFLGGNLAENGAAIAVDAGENATICGSTLSANFPVTLGAYQTSYAGGSTVPSVSGFFGDAFITRVNSSGTALIYSTYLGSTGDDGASSISVDSAGKSYIAGGTSSPTLQTTPGVVQIAGSGVVKSVNGGASWSRANNGLPDDQVLSINIDPADPEVAYVGTFGGGVYKTTDGGHLWTAINNGFTSLEVRATTIVDSSTLYAGADDGLFRTTSSGDSWERLPLPNGTISAVAVDPVTPTTIYAGTLLAATGGLFKSTDNGATWMTAGLDFVRCIVIDPSSPSTIYAAVDRLYRSRDAGATWSAAGNLFADISSLALDGATLYMGTTEGVFKSSDFGEHWTAADTGVAYKRVSALATSPAGVLYAGSSDGVFRTSDAGNTWTALNTGLSGALIKAIAVRPGQTPIVYAGISGFFKGFVAKLNASATDLDYLTYIGGTGVFPTSLATDTAGNVFITGNTNSGFPATPGGFAANGSGFVEAFAMKLNPTATSIEYATCLSGRSDDRAYAIAVDSFGIAYVAGATASLDFPVTPTAYQTVLADSLFGDGFITKLEPIPSLLADLEVTVSPAAGTVTAGSNLVLDVVLTNLGAEPAQLVTVTTFGDPAGTSNYTQDSSPFFIGGRLIHRSLGPGASEKARLFVSPSCRASNGQVMTFIVKAESLTPDSNQANNTASAQITVSGGGPVPISPVTASVGAAGGMGSVVVTTPGTVKGSCPWVAVSNSPWITVTSNPIGFGGGTVNYSVAANSSMSPRVGTITIATHAFTLTQSGIVTPSDTIGVYASSNQTFYLRNSNSEGFADFTIQYGPPGAIPLVGDWNGDGTSTIGVYDPANQTFYLNNGNSVGFADLTIRYGPSNVIPIAGDWNGDGTTTIGVYDPGSQTFYLRNSNSPGFADITIAYGPANAVPAVGDWDGNGTDTIGVFDPASQTFYLRNSNTIGFADLTIRFGPASATPVVGDWDGDGAVTIGVYDPTDQTFYLRNSNTIGFADLIIRYGPPASTPLSGDWDGL
jgi:photosystem II stability/assembly factor-like uncharacterized protein